MKMIVKHHLGKMSVTAKSPMACAEKIIAQGIQEATLIETAKPHTGRIISIVRGIALIIR